MKQIIQLTEKDIEQIKYVEDNAFIPTIQTTQENIIKRLNLGHIYLGVESDNKLVGTLALRYAKFVPDFQDFIKRNPNFDYYAESENEKDANASFVYSLGIIPSYRNAINAKSLIEGALELTKSKKLDYIIGDARIPSYNGSCMNKQYEYFEMNKQIHQAVEDYSEKGILPSRGLLEKDPVTGFYLKSFPEAKILGITPKDFWKGDHPCGGQMVVIYSDLNKK